METIHAEILKRITKPVTARNFDRVRSVSERQYLGGGQIESYLCTWQLHYYADRVEVDYFSANTINSDETLKDVLKIPMACPDLVDQIAGYISRTAIVLPADPIFAIRDSEAKPNRRRLR